jgi:hypothetical protein
MRKKIIHILVTSYPILFVAIVALVALGCAAKTMCPTDTSEMGGQCQLLALDATFPSLETNAENTLTDVPRESDDTQTADTATDSTDEINSQTQRDTTETASETTDTAESLETEDVAWVDSTTALSDIPDDTPPSDGGTG